MLGDLKYALRQLVKSPGVTAIAVATLALGIGASAAIFTLSSAIVLTSLPVEHPERLVSYDLRDGDRMRGLSGPFYKLLRERQRTSSDLMTWTNLAWMKDEKIQVRSGAQTTLEDIQFLSVNGFEVLGLRPYLGRGFAQADDDASVMPVILGYEYWRAKLGGDAGVMGRVLQIDGHPVTVIGVMPRGFDGLTGGLHPAVFLPLAAVKTFLGKDELTAPWPGHAGFFALGRLKDGVSIKEARAEAAAMEPTLRKEADPTGIFYAQFFKALRLSVRDGSSGFSWLKTTYESPLLVLEVLVGLFLVLCSVNTALVMLARVSGRQQEYAVRVALGANRARIVRQVVVETCLLAVPGMVFGVLLGWSGARVLGSMLSDDGFGLARQLDLRPSGLVLAVTAAVAVLVALGAAVVPAYRAARSTPAGDLKSAGRGVAAGGSGGWAIAVQVTVSLCLVSVAFLLGSTLMQLLTDHAGIDFADAATAEVDLSQLKLSDADGNRIFQRLERALEAQPGVSAVAYASPFPLYGHYTLSRAFSFDKEHRLHSQPSMSVAGISKGYFRAAGTRIVAGALEPEGARDSQGTANCVVSEGLARFFFPQEDAVGRMVYFSTFGKPDGTVMDPKAACRVVSVAEDAKYISLRRPAPEILYQLVRMDVLKDYAPAQDGDFVVRAASDAVALSAVRAAVAAVVPKDAAVKVGVFGDRVKRDLSRERMVVLLAGTFAVLALMLTALGLYGLLTRMVHLRRREIGIRVALGAQRGAVLVALGRRTALDLMVGLVVGTVAAVLVGQGVRRVLDMRGGSVVGGYGMAVGLILLVAVGALIPPARRAGRVDPMEALRLE